MFTRKQMLILEVRTSRWIIPAFMVGLFFISVAVMVEMVRLNPPMPWKS